MESSVSYWPIFLIAILAIDLKIVGVLPLLLGLRSPAKELRKEQIIGRFNCRVRTNYLGGMVSVGDGVFLSTRGFKVWITKKSIAIKDNYLTYRFKIDRDDIVGMHVVKLRFSYTALRLILKAENGSEQRFVDFVTAPRKQDRIQRLLMKD